MEHVYTVAMFGEAEKGQFQTAYFCKNLPQLEEYLGNPPPESRGLFYAVQALLYERNLIFFRVEEEGFSHQDYFLGLRMLEKKQTSYGCCCNLLTRSRKCRDFRGCNAALQNS